MSSFVVTMTRVEQLLRIATMKVKALFANHTHSSQI